jgi:AcrR family transcriptional regulator
MARSIDQTKIDRIKESTLQMVVSKGYGGASISNIAKAAGVADGYLYRFYKGKTELINDLLFTGVNQITSQLETQLEQPYDSYNLIEKTIRAIFSVATTHPVWIKFLYVLMHDYNFNIQEEQRLHIVKLCRQVKEIGLKLGQLRDSVTEEEIYLMCVVYPIQLINLRFKNFFGQTQISENEIQNTINICVNSLKK